jgi:hypothetical protein
MKVNAAQLVRVSLSLTAFSSTNPIARQVNINAAKTCLASAVVLPSILHALSNNSLAYFTILHQVASNVIWVTAHCESWTRYDAQLFNPGYDQCSKQVFIVSVRENFHYCIVIMIACLVDGRQCRRIV